MAERKKTGIERLFSIPESLKAARLESEKRQRRLERQYKEEELAEQQAMEEEEQQRVVAEQLKAAKERWNTFARANLVNHAVDFRYSNERAVRLDSDGREMSNIVSVSLPFRWARLGSEGMVSVAASKSDEIFDPDFRRFHKAPVLVMSARQQMIVDYDTTSRELGKSYRGGGVIRVMAYDSAAAALDPAQAELLKWDMSSSNPLVLSGTKGIPSTEITTDHVVEYFFRQITSSTSGSRLGGIVASDHDIYDALTLLSERSGILMQKWNTLSARQVVRDTIANQPQTLVWLLASEFTMSHEQSLALFKACTAGEVNSHTTLVEFISKDMRDLRIRKDSAIAQNIKERNLDVSNMPIAMFLGEVVIPTLAVKAVFFPRIQAGIKLLQVEIEAGKLYDLERRTQAEMLRNAALREFNDSFKARRELALKEAKRLGKDKADAVVSQMIHEQNALPSPGNS